MLGEDEDGGNIIGNVGDAKVNKDSPSVGEHQEGC
jgi:hypothetical protein